MTVIVRRRQLLFDRKSSGSNAEGEIEELPCRVPSEEN